AEFPDIQIILGLSNISFGLNPAARHVLNSVFLDHAQRRGLTGAILHSSKIMPLHRIAEEEVSVAEDLIFDRRRAGYDPLQAFMALFAERQVTAVRKERPAAVEERLKQRIVDGDRQGLEADLDEALGRYPPLDIINVHLLAGMKVVGDLFGAGKMQLPFVLQSAETMKAAVAYLEPHMERVEGSHKGTVVLATVKGDVHDIGKNLVDIILTNNGYRVVNLGIKQPLANILAAAQEHRAHAIGMSGLLVKSTVIMRENMAEMTRQGLDVPVMLGGAALTRQYVETDCVQAYASGRVAYARDAFDGLHLMDRIVSGCFSTYLAERQAKQAARPKRSRPERRLAAVEGEAPPLRPLEVEETRLRRNELSRGIEVPRPPFWGPRLIEEVPVRALVPYLNENMLYQFHWGFKKDGRSLDQFLSWAAKELRPVLAALIEEAERERIFAPQAVYGYWPAAGDGNDVVLFDPTDKGAEVARFALPRQAKKNGLCIADFLRDVAEPARDVIGLQVVTIGQRASEVARAWFAADRYNDYVRLHGLGVELAEALAEYVHKRIRAELGFSHLDARERHELLKQGYRGSRYSFGYPACPNLADQRPLLALLDASRIGVELAEEDQLHPEQSTSAIVLHHPQARYFNV
ncbi:MAG TPA: vitamin B12 dependent-methionine synthase activation domain-containing protein, partial [Geminicoccaceae bacterium]|nr:vitamin B12 dependent-methionine synthase activation domain-containing protein [Geminicoccaceae bacterium]